MKFTNTQLWLMVGAALAVYLILVLEDIADALSRNRYVVLTTFDNPGNNIKNITPVVSEEVLSNPNGETE